MLTVRSATLADVFSLAQRLRPADKLEVYASGFASAVDALAAGLKSPDGCCVAVDDNDVAQIIFGTHPTEEPLVGLVWMMGSESIVTNQRQLIRETRHRLQGIFGQYNLLTNIAHAQNEAHLNWLRWAGFSLIRKLTINDHVWIEFAMIKPGV